MNRPIRFRAWDKERKQIVYVFGISQAVYDQDCEGEPEWKHTQQIQEILVSDFTMKEPFFEKPNWVDASGYELMQFTGLLDKNGKEIYENDIYSVNGKIFHVIFKRGAFVLKNQNENNLHRLHNAVHNGIVVGNNCENPELLISEQKTSSTTE